MLFNENNNGSKSHLKSRNNDNLNKYFSEA